MVGCKFLKLRAGWDAASCFDSCSCSSIGFGSRQFSSPWVRIFMQFRCPCNPWPLPNSSDPLGIELATRS